MLNDKNTVNALEIAKKYAGLEDEEINKAFVDYCEGLCELNTHTDDMTYIFYIDLSASGVLGFDCSPVGFSARSCY